MGNTNVKPHPKPRNKKQVRWKAADRPSPPGKPSLIQENNSVPDVVHICWPKPEKDGGSTVTSYLVEHRRVGTSHWLKSSPFQITTNELAVNGLEAGWRYQFRVRAENAVGLSDASEISEPYSATLQRSAIAAPKFTEELKDTVALEHGKVEFEVNFLGQPPPNLCWFKDGFEIFSGNRTRITTTSDRSVFTILQATVADEGEIKCTATNRAGHSSTKCKLTIEAPPTIKLPKSYQDPDGIIFEIGETIKMNVTVSGRPTPLIFWSHDGESIQNNDRYDIEYNDKIASVRIENALRSDRGEYQIKAVNKLGQDRASYLVTITDKPTPPGKARVLLTSGKSVTLCWSTPKDDGGCRVGNYIIEYYRIGWDVWLKAATTRQLSTMLGDLIEGSQYKFRIKAESPYGVSDPSEESEVVFIPDLKRGIQEPSDVKRDEVESRMTLAKRRRANSTPRVSFVLNEDAPVRPERKKTGKTPEASPRLKRRQIFSFSKNVLGSEPSLNRSFSSYSGAQGLPTWNNSFEANISDNSIRKIAPIMIQGEKNKKSPSPEIIITDADVENDINLKKLISKSNPDESSSRSPNFFDRSSWESTKHENKQPEKQSYIANSSRIDKNSFVPNLYQFRNSPNHQEKFQTSPEKSPSKSPDLHKGSPLSSLNNSPTSPSSSPNFLEKSPSRSPNVFERSPPRSPEKLETSPAIIIFNQKSQPKNAQNLEKSPSPNRQAKHIQIIEHNKNGNTELKRDDYTLHKITDLENFDRMQSQDIKDRMRPPLRQEFSGSSEFMLVLCPEGEQGTRFKRFSISFDENSIPPPLSLSAPELGFEPPELPSLKRSASSTELLTYHLMERLHEAAMNESNTESSKANTNIPTIRVNSESTEFNSFEDNTSFKRRLSGTIPNQSSWSNRRYSLKNAKEINDNFATRLQRFEETDEMRREVQEYRKITEFEHEQEDARRDLADGDEWLKDYEESIPSEDESDLSSPDERKISLFSQIKNDINEDEEEIYNPRNRMMTAVKADNDQPFEILTVRKDPPKSNIVPKPILKKTSPSRTEEEPTYSRNTIPSFMLQTQPPNNLGIEKDSSIPKRNRSNSLSASFEDELDVSQIKRSPTPIKRRSFSLIPSQAHFITDALKSKNQKNSEEADSPKSKAAKNVSALANFTSIAGAGFVIPNEMQEKKEIEEEAKVVVDFYGDIVKNFGGRSKPTAEFSTSVASKYDTFEERKISDIKPNADTLASHNFRPKSPTYSERRGEESSVLATKVPPISTTQPQKEVSITNFPQTEAIGGTLNKKPVNSSFNVSQLENFQSEKQTNFDNLKNRKTLANSSPSRERDESLKKMRAELSQSKIPGRTSMRYQNEGSFPNRLGSESKRTGRMGSRNSSVGRRKRTPMSRDASTSPVRFSDDWDSQCSSKTSLEQDYYNRGSLNSSRASSLSRRSLSPPRPKLRGITTQTSFRIETGSPADVQDRMNLAKEAEKRMSFVLEYSTDLAMVAVAGWLFLFQSEYLAVPFILIPIYRQLGQNIKSFTERVERRLPQWIRKRLRRNR